MSSTVFKELQKRGIEEDARREVDGHLDYDKHQKSNHQKSNS